MKIKNLKKMVFLLEELPDNMFNIGKFRDEADNGLVPTKPCCGLGHCVILAPELVTKNTFGQINFVLFFNRFVQPNDNSKILLSYLFSGNWMFYDGSKVSCIDRINQVINRKEVTLEDLPWASSSTPIYLR